MKKLTTILVCLVSIFIGIGIGYFLFHDKNDEINNQNNNTNKPVEISDELLENIKGVWAYCAKDDSCYTSIIEENDGQYTYRIAQIGTGGTPGGVIKNTKNKENNKYEIEVYFEAYDSPMSSNPERTEYYNIDITNLNNNQITIGDIVYDYISKTYEYEKIEDYINEKSNG